MNTGFEGWKYPWFHPRFLIPLLTVACRTATGRRYDTQERAMKICLVGPLGVSAAQGLLPVGMATSHCSVGVAVDAVLVMVAEVTVSRPDALRFFGYRDYYSRRACALERKSFVPPLPPPPRPPPPRDSLRLDLFGTSAAKLTLRRLIYLRGSKRPPRLPGREWIKIVQHISSPFAFAPLTA